MGHGFFCHDTTTLIEIIWRRTEADTSVAEIDGRLLKLELAPPSVQWWQVFSYRREYLLTSGTDCWCLRLASWGRIDVRMPERFDGLDGQLLAESEERGTIHLGDRPPFRWAVLGWDLHTEIRDAKGKVVLTSKRPWKGSEIAAGIRCRCFVEDNGMLDPFLDFLLASALLIGSDEFTPKSSTG